MATNLYLADTHALFWQLTAHPNLSAAAARVFQESSAGNASVLVSHVVVAELFYLLTKVGRAGLFDQAVQSVRNSPAYQVAPLIMGDLIRLPDFTEIPEMHDRLIAIQANRLGATILTKDASIRASKQIQCLW
ncbi:MAG TPA: PIN domain-containing protein [Tepidisphaeraceae bacterium]|nr:PIN domain-containing protein [Tepidisphaeraceae bacterium]